MKNVTHHRRHGAAGPRNIIFFMIGLVLFIVGIVLMAEMLVKFLKFVVGIILFFIGLQMILGTVRHKVFRS